MRMMNTVLLVTNFSEAARNAAKYVLDWANDIRLKCKIVLLNTYLIPSAAPDQLVQLNDKLREASLKNLEMELAALKTLHSKNHDIQIESVSHMGTLESVVSYMTLKSGIVCVAIGDDGILNSLSLKKITCPVLAIPSDAHYARGDFSSKIALPQTSPQTEK